jgi:hypothetical protein
LTNGDCPPTAGRIMVHSTTTSLIRSRLPTPPNTSLPSAAPSQKVALAPPIGVSWHLSHPTTPGCGRQFVGYSRAHQDCCRISWDNASLSVRPLGVRLRVVGSFHQSCQGRTLDAQRSNARTISLEQNGDLPGLHRKSISFISRRMAFLVVCGRNGLVPGRCLRSGLNNDMGVTYFCVRHKS